MTVIGSTALVEQLNLLPDAPWASYFRGKPITVHRVASMLREHKIKPRHTEDGNVYHRDDFAEAWKRYVREEASPNQPSVLQEMAENGVKSECYDKKHKPSVTFSDLQQPPVPEGSNDGLKVPEDPMKVRENAPNALINIEKTLETEGLKISWESAVARASTLQRNAASGPCHRRSTSIKAPAPRRPGRPIGSTPRSAPRHPLERERLPCP